MWGWSMSFGTEDIGMIINNPFESFGLDGIAGQGYIFVGFQLTFAVITAALISGAVADRLKFSAWMLFVPLWLTLSYFPLAHMVWGGGFLGTAPNGLAELLFDGNPLPIDYAGGTVVHINAGMAGLVLAHPARQATRVRQGADEAAQPDAHDDRRRPALVRLVRLQRRLDRLQR